MSHFKGETDWGGYSKYKYNGEQGYIINNLMKMSLNDEKTGSDLTAFLSAWYNSLNI